MATGGPGGDPSLFDFSAELPGWFPMGLVESSGDPPSLPISPILSMTPEDSVVGNLVPSRDEPDTPSGTDSLPDALLGYSPPDLSRPILTSPAEVFSDLPDCPTSRDVRRSPGPVPCWRLSREGPFLSEPSSSSLNCFGDGCAFRNTTYHPSDYTKPSGEFGVPLHHPRFLEWIGVPESANLLEMGLGMWLHSLSRYQAMDAALQLHRDVCPMTTNLDVLDQYVLCLQGTASKILELGLEPRGFPSAEVAAGAMGPGSAELLYRWRQWDCGGPRWIRYSFREVSTNIGHYFGQLLWSDTGLWACWTLRLLICVGPVSRGLLYRVYSARSLLF